MALIYCNECEKQISDKAANCPHCGNPISATAPVSVSAPASTATANIEKIVDRDSFDRAQIELKECKTNHWLHLVLSVLTLGIWSWVWLFVAIRNSNKRKDIKIKYGLEKDPLTPRAKVIIQIVSGLIAGAFGIFVYTALTTPSTLVGAKTLTKKPAIEAVAAPVKTLSERLMDKVDANAWYLVMSISTPGKEEVLVIGKDMSKDMIAGEDMPNTSSERMVGMSADECVKLQLKITNSEHVISVYEKQGVKAEDIAYQCSRMMMQKVRAVEDSELKYSYQLMWMGDYVTFTEVKDFKTCKAENKLMKDAIGYNPSFCGKSFQLIK